jgi:hypothetical protein
VDLTIAALLTQDGITNGAIYALLALALVLGLHGDARDLRAVGRVRRVGTLTLAGLQLGKAPASSACSSAWRRRGRSWSRRRALRAASCAAFRAAARCGRACRSPSPRWYGGWRRQIRRSLSEVVLTARRRHLRLGGRCSTDRVPGRTPKRACSGS